MRLKFLQDRPTRSVKKITNHFEFTDYGALRGFLQCMIIHSYGGVYDDKIKAIPMEMPSQDSTADYSTLSHKREDIEDFECYIKSDINKEFSFTLYDAPDSQKSKQSYLDFIEILFRECTKSGGIKVYNYIM